jgi:hypothetical protein
MESRDRNHLRRASEIAAASHVARRLAPPLCDAIVDARNGRDRRCGARLAQNAVERERGVWWCSRCQRYTDGSKGFPIGHPLRPNPEAINAPKAEEVITCAD